jgi:hypothetical protein
MPNTTEEETDDEEFVGEEEEEDVDAIVEMRDGFEENLSPGDDETIAKLMGLGFDRNIVTPVLFMCQGDEQMATHILTQILASMP